MSMEERTLVVRDIDGDRLSIDLLDELFSNFGPLVRVVLRPTFAFIEYTKKESVGYAWAMTEGIYLLGRKPRIAPKLIDDPEYYIYRDRLQEFEHDIHSQPKSFDALITKRQINEKRDFVAALNSRSNGIPASTARRRYRKYLRHFEPYDTFNPLLGKDLSVDDRERERELNHHRRLSNERHSNEGHNNRDGHRSHSDRNNNNSNNSHQYHGHGRAEQYHDTSRYSSRQDSYSNRDRRDRHRDAEYGRHDRHRSEGGSGGHRDEKSHRRDRFHR